MTSPSFEEVVAGQGPAIWRLTAVYARSRADREDLHQEILTAVWRALPRFRGDSSLATYVLRIAHNRGLTWRARSRRERSADLSEADGVADSSPPPDDRIHREWQGERLSAALRDLRPALAQPVALYLEGLTYPEIAAVLGISETNVGVRLNRARAELSRALRGREAS